MSDEMSTMPTRVAAWLVAGHVDQLWQQWANDAEVPGCCPECCGPCAGLKALYDTDQLDSLYGAYVDHVGGQMDTWDAAKRQVGRAWLLEEWSLPCDLHRQASE